VDVAVCPYLGTFDDVVETVNCGLRALRATGCVLPDRTIVIGAHLLPWSSHSDERHIFYNFEQRDSPALNASVLDMFRRHEVWDYSASNVAWLAEHGVYAQHVPLGYTPELKRLKRTAKPDIDVLFYGLVNERRRRILDGLGAAGLTVCEAINCYGFARDQLIARSKIVLNMHFYEAGIFEIVRCYYLFANETCVVSETSVDVPSGVANALPFATYEQLVSTCVALVKDDAAAAAWATRTHQAFRSYDEAAILKKAIDGPRS
jgi:hypothetical protein